MTEEKKPKDPMCPKCKTQPINFGHNTVQSQTGAIVSAIWCIDCGHILNIQQIGQQGPKIIDPTSTGTRILQM